MDFWGFESRQAVVGESFGLLKNGAPGAVGGGGAGAAAAKKSDNIPYNIDRVQRREFKSADELNKALKSGQQDAWVVFQVNDPRRPADAKRILGDPNQRPAAGTFWAYQVKFTEKDGLPGVTSKEEAAQLKKQVEDLINKNKKLGDVAVVPKIYYFGSDTNGDKKLDVKDLTEENLAGITNKADHGKTAAQVIKDNGGVIPPELSTAMDDLTALFAKDQESRDKQKKKLDALIRWALSGGLNFDNLLSIMRDFSTKFSQHSLDFAALAMKVRNEANKRKQERIAELKTVSPDPKDPESYKKWNELQLDMRNDDQALGPIDQALRASLDDIAKNGQEIREFEQGLRRIKQAG